MGGLLRRPWDRSHAGRLREHDRGHNRHRRPCGPGPLNCEARPSSVLPALPRRGDRSRICFGAGNSPHQLQRRAFARGSAPCSIFPPVGWRESGPERVSRLTSGRLRWRASRLRRRSRPWPVGDRRKRRYGPEPRVLAAWGMDLEASQGADAGVTAEGAFGTEAPPGHFSGRRRLRLFDTMNARMAILLASLPGILIARATGGPAVKTASEATGSANFSLTRPFVYAASGGVALAGRACRRARSTLLSPQHVRIEHISPEGAVLQATNAYLPSISRRSDEPCSNYAATVDWKVGPDETLRACFDRGRPCPAATTWAQPSLPPPPMRMPSATP